MFSVATYDFLLLMENLTFRSVHTYGYSLSERCGKLDLSAVHEVRQEEHRLREEYHEQDDTHDCEVEGPAFLEGLLNGTLHDVRHGIQRVAAEGDDDSFAHDDYLSFDFLKTLFSQKRLTKAADPPFYI